MIEPAVRLFEDIERERRELNHIQDPDQAKESAHRAAGAIRDDLDDADLLIQEKRFPELYNTAVGIAGKSVRLAAVARQGMIQTEGGEYGKTD